MCRPRTKKRGFAGAAAALLGAALLGGCSDIYMDHRDSISFTAGDAVAANQTAQMYDPWPPQSRNVNYGANGQRMQTAVERYRTNQVTAPVSATAMQGGNPSPLVAQTIGSQSGGPAAPSGAGGGGSPSTATVSASGQ